MAVPGGQDLDLPPVPPGIGHHQKAPVPEGEDEGLTGVMQAVRYLLVEHFPVAGRVDDADVLRRRPAQRRAQPLAPRYSLEEPAHRSGLDRKSTRLNSSH